MGTQKRPDWATPWDAAQEAFDNVFGDNKRMTQLEERIAKLEAVIERLDSELNRVSYTGGGVHWPSKTQDN